MKKDCNVNFGKVSDKSVKVFEGDSRRKDIEIIGQKVICHIDDHEASLS